MADVPEVHLTTRQEWHKWLVEHHETAPAVWLVSWRTVTDRPQIDYEAIVEEALCFGWVDSTIRTIDAERNARYLTRRRKGSPWARTNKERVARLRNEGRMRPAGIAAVERAKADGSWTLLDDIEDLVVPPDLAVALEARPDARGGYEALNPSVRKQVLWWVVSAKRPETRARRVAATVEAAAAGRSPL